MSMTMMPKKVSFASEIFGVIEPPPVDFSTDIDPIEAGNVSTVKLSKIIPRSLSLICVLDRSRRMLVF